MALRGRPRIGRPAFTRLPADVMAALCKKCKRLKIKNIDFGLNNGEIFSVRLDGITRGLIRSRSRKYLKNSVSIDIVIGSNKYINVKRSEKNGCCGMFIKS